MIGFAHLFKTRPHRYVVAMFMSGLLFVIALTLPEDGDRPKQHISSTQVLPDKNKKIAQHDTRTNIDIKPIQQNLFVAPETVDLSHSEPITPASATSGITEERLKPVRVRKGDTLSKILSQHGLSPQSIYKVQSAMDNIGEKSTIFPGQVINLLVDFSDRVTQISIPTSNKQSTVIELLYAETDTLTLDNPISISATTQVIPTDTRIVYRSGTIETSLFESANKAGLSDALIMRMAGLFAWEIDFILDIRQGDQFRILYEELWSDEGKVENGQIIATQFINQGKTHTGILFEDETTDTYGYFEKDGSNLKKAFLRSPVDFARVSSHFNLKRRHPILHKIRAHRGVDYAAARGTPVKATGQGVVAFKGSKGGFGRTIVLKHGQNYTTLYAHLNGFHRSLRTGSKVEQGQIIGYVGSSGLATGPHLHYEFRINNVHKNPLTVKLPAADSIPEGLMHRFKQHSATQLALFEQYEQSTLASLEDKTPQGTKQYQLSQAKLGEVDLQQSEAAPEPTQQP